ncbi:MAG: ChaN family lipoprotein [Balneolales bacterium]|nr:ChaN family lipoprotein [Balneolales bacterium]
MYYLSGIMAAVRGLLLFFAVLQLGSCSAVATQTLQVQNSSENPQAYALFDASGEQLSYSAMLEKALSADIILFGELHNNAIAHWLQHELARSIASADTTALTIGMEMFEADQQLLLDEYLAGIISGRSFENEARLWSNYHTDYKPLVMFAKASGIPLAATNIPRRYASLVYQQGLEGLESLSEEARLWIAPLPVKVDLELPGYARIFEMAHGHGGENLPKAQAIKDATMAHRILLSLEENSGRHLHLNGAYHSDFFEGIYWYLRHYGFSGRIVTITTAEENAPDIFNNAHENKANIILQVNSRMTKTH